MKSELLFVGPPGAGKGTQASKICSQFGHIHISTGNILREAIAEGTELGNKAKTYMDQGQLVPDSLVDALVSARLSQLKQEEPFLLDGYPRNVEQAKHLDDALAKLGRPLSLVIELTVPEDELVKRLLNRARVEGRADDTEEVILNRMKVYKELTVPVMEHYREQGKHCTVSGDRAVDKVFQDIEKAITKP